MNSDLDLQVPKREAKPIKQSSKGLFILNMIVLIAICANIALVLVRSHNNSFSSDGASLSIESKKQLALKLERQDLNTASVSAWKEYIKASHPDQREAAMIWYRIGKLYQENHQYEKALESYYRSESFTMIDDIDPEISRRIQECLESMGKTTALRYELDERVGMKTSEDDSNIETEGGQIVAEIGSQKISKAALDRQIEQHIDRQLSQFASYLPEDERRKQKDQLLKQFSSSAKRQMFLNQLILEEILYRKAYETNLRKAPEIRDMLKDQERSLLAGMLIEKEFEDKINILHVDLETYYTVHKNDYLNPEKAKIAHILVSNESDAKKVRQQFGNGMDFEELAKAFSMDASTRNEGGRILEWIEKGKNVIPGIGDSEDAMQAIFTTKTGQIIDKDVNTSKGIHIIKVLEHEAERQKTFDEAKNEIYRDLRSQKERDVQQQLLSELKEQYDVVVHQSAFME